MAALDLASLKEYVTGGTRQVNHSVVLLDIEHNLIKQRFIEIPFDINATISAVKQKVYTVCGSQPQFQKLTLRTSNGSVVLEDDTRTLGSYGAVGGTNGGTSIGQHLYVEDLDPFALGRGGALDDVSLVQKYVMSDEEYAKRENTYRAFKAKQRAIDPNWQPVHAKSRPTPVPQPSEAEIKARISVGMRAQIQPGSRRGKVTYIGNVGELPGGGTWIGIALDEPLGKHDGELMGRRYFQCAPKHGTFVRATKVEVGDFPEVDPFDEDSDAEQEEEKEDVYEEL